MFLRDARFRGGRRRPVEEGGNPWNELGADCSKPAGDGNYGLSYGLTAKGVPAETLRSAPGNDKVRELRNVQIISREWTVYTMTDTDGELIDILTRRTGDRKKSWWSVGKEGKAYILDGKFLDSGEPPWFQLCK